jgi:predicted branched-subunit amino acid permease
MSPAPDPPQRPAASFLTGFTAAWRAVLSYVLIGTYVGIAALAHDLGFGLWWVVAATALLWVAPGQVILISALGGGATAIETAVAIGVSGARLCPMVVSLLPLIRHKSTPTRHLLLPAHFTAISVWIEALRLLPALPREARLSFLNGLGVGFLVAAELGTFLGYYLVGSLPPLLTAALLFLTPMSFLISTTRNCRALADWLALGIGTVLGPLLAWWQLGFDLVWTGIVGGSLAYGIQRLREALR